MGKRIISLRNLYFLVTHVADPVLPIENLLYKSLRLMVLHETKVVISFSEYPVEY